MKCGVLSAPSAKAQVRGVFLSVFQIGLVCGWGVVGGLVFEHGEDEVAAAAGDADDGGVVVYSFCSFALVVGPGCGVVL